MKWYEDILTDEDIIISSRVRLARNIRKYPFAVKMNKNQAEAVLNDIKDSVLNERTPLGSRFKFYNMAETEENLKLDLMARHLISPDLVKTKRESGALVMDDESISIMINEEDHIRIQTFAAGDNIEKAYDLADKIDNIMEETLDYAFDEKYGFITSCPTNFGTGLRVSYMMHLPCLERTGNIKQIINAVSKYGITVRGIYGEGTEASGSIYQISNQVTLGKSEKETLELLKNVGNIVKEQEMKMREALIVKDRIAFADRIYRSYGILVNAKRISASEAMDCLSDVRLGYISGVLEKKRPLFPINSIIISSQPAVLQMRAGSKLSPEKRDAMRAAYINKMFEN
ncbi:MAG: protein arginine kinase [Lachnospiraceae bacterium]|nr:protein arginine kinase [Lachnospiraceae bacterium]